MNIILLKKQTVQTPLKNTLAADILDMAEDMAEFFDYTHEIIFYADQFKKFSEQVEGLLNAPLAEGRTYKKLFFFLACPYTANTREEMQRNLAFSQYATVFLMKQGVNVYNPLSHGSNIIHYADEGFIHDYTPYFNWHEMNCRIMEACDAFVWLDSKLTDSSKGIAAELSHAKMLNMPILGLRQDKENMFKFHFLAENDEKLSRFPITATIG